MKYLNVTLLCLGLLLPFGAELAWGEADIKLPELKGTLPVEAGCPTGETCTLDLGPGHWIILTPKGQTVDRMETDNEARYRIETPRPGPKAKP